MTEIDNKFKVALLSEIRHRKLNFTVIMDGNLMNFCGPIVQEWMMAEIVECIVVNSLATQTVVIMTLLRLN